MKINIKNLVQGESNTDDEIDNFGWDTDDELETQKPTLSSCSSLIVPSGSSTVGSGEVNVCNTTYSRIPCMLAFYT